MSQSTPYDTVKSRLLSHPHIFLSPPASPHKLHIPQNQSQSSSVPTISSLSVHPVLESLLHILNLDLPAAHFLCRHAEVAPKWESMYVHGMLHRVEGDVTNTRAWYGNVRETEIFRSVWEGAQDGEGEMPTIAREGWNVFLDRLEGWRDRTRRRREKKQQEQRVRRRRESEGVSVSSGERRGSAGVNEDGDGGVTNGHERRVDSEVTDWAEEERLLAETSLWELLSVLRYCEKKFGTHPLDVREAKGEFLGRIESGDERLQKIAESMITGGEGWRVW